MINIATIRPSIGSVSPPVGVSPLVGVSPPVGVSPVAGSLGVSFVTPPLAELVLPRLTPGDGLPVAVFVPWRQTWKQQGFSRGNLLQSLAMAPGEEVTLR